MSVASATILRRSAKQSGGEAASHLADASDPRASSVLGLRDPRFFVRIRGKLGRALLLGIPALVVVAMGVGDLYTPPQLTFGILYLLPIVASGWMLGRRAGFALAGLAALVWLLAEAVSHPGVRSWILVWNGFSRFLVFGFIGLLVAELREITDHLEQMVADRTRLLEEETAQRLAIEREIAAKLERDQERISHEFHDGLGQHLAGAAYMAKALENRLAALRLPESRQAGELQVLMRDAITEARALARGLDPIELQNRDLAAALEDLAGETRERFGIQCHFRCIEPAALRVSRPAGLAIYRICQEAIHNAVAHGEPGSVHIDLAVQKGELRIEVRDDGRGFDPGAVHKSGMGLRIMRSRAASAGGRLSMVSKPGEGTVITCILPLETFAVIEEAKE